MTALRRQALGDGFLDFLLLLRNEGERAHPSDVHLVGLQRPSARRCCERSSGKPPTLASNAFHDRPRRDRLRAVLSRFPVCRRMTGARGHPAHRALAQRVRARGRRCRRRSRSTTVDALAEASAHSAWTGAPILTPHGSLILGPSRGGSGHRLQARSQAGAGICARGSGHGLLSLGADQVGLTVLPPVLSYWRGLGGAM